MPEILNLRLPVLGMCHVEAEHVDRFVKASIEFKIIYWALEDQASEYRCISVSLILFRVSVSIMYIKRYIALNYSVGMV